jgi:DNA polymerase I-like protein with 3'-5' exonuclease and polymerase domains
MIHLVTARGSEYSDVKLKENDIVKSKGKDFASWFDNYKGDIQVDTETNVVRDVYGYQRQRKGKNGWHKPDLDESGNKIPVERECYVVQIGDKQGETQWIFDMEKLSGKKLNVMLDALRSDRVKLIHNGLFDYVVVKWNFGIDMTNIRDTFLMSKITTTGLKVGEDLPSGYNSLAGCALRYLGIDLSKAAQTSFSKEPMSVEQITYAATDVTILGLVHDALQKEVDEHELENVVRLESALVRPYGDAMCENFYLDPLEWKQNMALQEKELHNSIEELHSVIREDLHDECVELNFIQKEDGYKFDWAGRNLKKLLMRIAYPNLADDCTTVIKYNKYLKELLTQIDEDAEKVPNPDILQMYLAKDFEQLERLFISRYDDILKDMGLFTPKGKILINFNSDVQVLALFQLVKPSIENANKETIGKINHPLAFAYKKYQKSAKLVTSYGDNFLDYISPDGQLRIPKITQILNTGRTSLGLYQLLPGKAAYRTPFKPNHPETGVRDDGNEWVVVGIDYSSQEAVVAATFCQEEQLLDAIRNGYDFHSTCASLMFPDEWKELGGDPKPTGKPKHPKLVELRNKSKVTSFGLMYGKSAIGLAESLDLLATTEELIEFYPMEAKKYINENAESYNKWVNEFKKGKKSRTSRRLYLKEAHADGKFLPDVITGADLVDRFYGTFPNIRKFLVEGADDAVDASFIATPDPFRRKRFFPRADSTREQKSIHRKAMNYPIQSSSANMTKYAIVQVKKTIEKLSLQDRVKFALPIHDEIQCIVRKDFAEEWMPMQMKCMDDAGKLVLSNTLQKAEGEISETWIK